MRMFEEKMKEIKAECEKIDVLTAMLYKNTYMYCEHEGMAGLEYPKNHNASKAAILNQITTLRNELLVLAETIKK